MFKMLICFIVTQLVTIGALCGTYVLDTDGPLHLTDTPHSWTMPDRLSIYVTTAQKYRLKSIYDYDRLQPHRPAYSSTNKDEIIGLVSLLQQKDVSSRLTINNDTVVVVYHILLFRDSDMTVMHYRIFQPVVVKSNWYMVYPVTRLGYCYFNMTIGPWLHSRIKHPERLP